MNQRPKFKSRQALFDYLFPELHHQFLIAKYIAGHGTPKSKILNEHQVHARFELEVRKLSVEQKQLLHDAYDICTVEFKEQRLQNRQEALEKRMERIVTGLLHDE